MALEAIINGAASAPVWEYTRPGLMVPRLREGDTAGIISELSQVLQRAGAVPDVLPFYHAAVNRELLTSSALGCGLAIPHARLSGIKQLQFALGRTAQAVLWGAKGPERVDLVFLLAVPATDAVGYLHLLASLARLGQSAADLNALRAAPDGPAMLAVLERAKYR